jgi:hypothetical protein
MKRGALHTEFFILLAAALVGLLMAAALVQAAGASAKDPESKHAWKAEPQTTSSVNTLYVKPVASGSENCHSWANACSLQTALGSAAAGDEVWVAEGIYYPGPSGVLTATFQLQSGVGLYGGFAATETLRTQRDWVAKPTILSGDIDENDVTDGGVVTDTVGILGSNAYHVVTGSGTDGTAILDGFTITAGDANTQEPEYHQYGGGMYNSSGSPTLTHVVFSGNRAGAGGGMHNFISSPTLMVVTFSGNSAAGGGGMHNSVDSSPMLTDVSFSGNSATIYGGGMFNDYNSSPNLTNVTFYSNNTLYIYGSYGGGMYNDNSNPTLTNVTFASNSATDCGGGMYNENSSPTLTNVTFYNNTGGNRPGFGDGGGGMYNYSSSPTLMDVTFSGNSATGGGGMFNYENSSPTLTNVTFSGNSAYNGGGMFTRDNTLTLTNVIFSGNSATNYGGGMHIDSSSLTLTDVSFYDNSAVWDGGGMYNGPGNNTILMGVSFSGNTAVDGGGMFNGYDNNTTLMNVTFSGNSADYGGGMFNTYDNPTLTNVTFTGNSAVNGGGMYNENNSSPTLTNAILWGNTPDQILGDPATVTYSDIQGDLYPGTGNINTDPLLGPLADNGGATLTHALVTGSPAIDAGSPATCPLTDQRGWPRPVDGDFDGAAICDMGAYEYTPRYTYLPLVVR